MLEGGVGVVLGLELGQLDHWDSDYPYHELEGRDFEVEGLLVQGLVTDYRFFYGVRNHVQYQRKQK